MSYNQRDVLRICQKLSKKYRDDFSGFVDDLISFDGLSHKGLTWQQKEIADNLVKNRFVCVSAGGGIGKSALAALFVLWFLSTHLFSKIPTTAPSRKQLKDVLWAQISFWLRRFKYREIFESFSERLIIRHYPDWYAVARTVPKEGNSAAINDTLAGFHGDPGQDNLLIVVDEASGVPDQVFTAIEGAMTSDAYILLISNPVSTSGYYYDTIYDPEGKGKSYTVLYYDSRESPLVDEAFEQRIIERYGKDSAMYISKVTGRPVGQIESVVVSPERYERIVSSNRLRYDGDIVVAVDVGGIGTDPTVFCHRSGMSIIRWDTFDNCDPSDVTDECLRIYERLYKDKYVKFIVDGVGPGAGVVSNLQRVGRFVVIPFKGSEKSISPSMYKNKRSEGYYELSKKFDMLHFPVRPPERLKKELAYLFFDFSEGPINMEPKKRFVSRLGFSPDYADALMMANSVGIATGAAIRPFVRKNKSSGLTVLKKDDKYKKEYRKFIV